mmetsp:Transcript_28301/g.45642  ORF Transcript_28301/g.45642 Transcript_28301/m.45642 type:complete len:265 (-) Transcript_28301:113-907(-)
MGVGGITQDAGLSTICGSSVPGIAEKLVVPDTWAVVSARGLWSENGDECLGDVLGCGFVHVRLAGSEHVVIGLDVTLIDQLQLVPELPVGTLRGIAPCQPRSVLKLVKRVRVSPSPGDVVTHFAHAFLLGCLRRLPLVVVELLVLHRQLQKIWQRSAGGIGFAALRTDFWVCTMHVSWIHLAGHGPVAILTAGVAAQEWALLGFAVGGGCAAVGGKGAIEKWTLPGAAVGPRGDGMRGVVGHGTRGGFHLKKVAASGCQSAFIG